MLGLSEGRNAPEKLGDGCDRSTFAGLVPLPSSEIIAQAEQLVGPDLTQSLQVSVYPRR